MTVSSTNVSVDSEVFMVHLKTLRIWNGRPAPDRMAMSSPVDHQYFTSYRGVKMKVFTFTLQLLGARLIPGRIPHPLEPYCSREPDAAAPTMTREKGWHHRRFHGRVSRYPRLDCPRLRLAILGGLITVRAAPRTLWPHRLRAVGHAFSAIPPRPPHEPQASNESTSGPLWRRRSPSNHHLRCSKLGERRANRVRSCSDGCERVAACSSTTSASPDSLLSP